MSSVAQGHARRSAPAQSTVAIAEALEIRQLFAAHTTADFTTAVAAIVNDLLQPVISQFQRADWDDDHHHHDDESEWWESRDHSKPKATIEAKDLDEAIDSDLTIVVRYEDDRAIDLGSIDGGDLTAIGPGGTQATATLIGTDSQELGTKVIATYSLTFPGGTWNHEANGEWTLHVGGDTVTDAWGNGIRSESEDFRVELSVPPPEPVPPPSPPTPPEPPAVPSAPPVDEHFSGGAPVAGGFVVEGALTLDDGRIILVGRQGSISNGTSQGVVRRLNADGSADSSFGKAGVVTTPVVQNAAFHGVAMSANGGFVVTGQQAGDVLVAKYKANGAIDKAFGVAGKTTFDWGASDAAYAVAIDSDGRIVVGGGSNGAFGISRLSAAGDIDTFFGSRGTALFALEGDDNTVGAVALQPDGRILAAGSVAGSVAVFRLSADGQTDRTFGSGGVAVLKSLSSRTESGALDHTFGLSVQSDHGILIANRSDGNFAIERLLFSGNRDRTFGRSGRTSIDFGGDDDADAIVVQQSGEVVVVGTTGAQSGRLAVAVLRADGSLNTDYADNGKLTLEAGIGSTGRALHAGTLVLRAFAAARGNQVVVGGSDGETTSGGTGLRRLNVPGSGLIGRFGAVDGKNKTLRFVDGDGTVISLALTDGGSGQAYYDGSNVDLVLSGVDETSQVRVGAAGGDGRMKLRNVQSENSIGSLIARTADITGTFWIGGSAKKLTFGNVAGTVATGGSIGTLNILNDANRATILAGANLGSDHQLGGKGTKADTFAAASISTVHVRGQVTRSLFAAGLDRGNSTFLDRDDRIIGGEASRIGVVRIGKGIDDASRFVCGSLGKANLPIEIDTTDDERFVVL